MATGKALRCGGSGPLWLDVESLECFMDADRVGSGDPSGGLVRVQSSSQMFRSHLSSLY